MSYKQTREHIAKRLASWVGKPRKLQDLETKLFKKIRIYKSGCWIWTGAKYKKTTGDYGQIRIGGKLRKVHQISYEHFIGEIPKGLELDHLCKNTLCVNPKHLEPVTHKVNMERGKNATKTHCKRGHRYTTETTYIHLDGKRECRICKKKSTQKSYYKLKK